HLRQLLKRDRRGLIVSMIHKFDLMPADINPRENIFVLVDEAHRTTGGKLGNYLMGALPNATYLGFTGTPIDKTSYGQGTFVVFGKDDPPEGYLDKYSIAESIEDGTTVRLHYTLAPSNLLVDREMLEEEFLNQKEAEGISDIEVLNRVLERAVNLRNMLKNERRVQDVARYVARHYREHVEPMGYKAFLVAVDREACALYKEALDEHLPNEYSTVVYSPGQNDEELLAKHQLSEDEEKRVRKAFRRPAELPKILIVTEKLLTGFDAPILYCMYLDKPMRDHVLLQAIARVNRPYEDNRGHKKPSGFILDFVGIFDHLEKALAFDSADIAGVVDDIQMLKDSFREMMERGAKEFLGMLEGKAADKAVDALLEHFRDEEPREEFFEFFRQLSATYEVLSPDAFLRPFLEDYRALGTMYRILKENFEPGIRLERELLKKTGQLVREHTQSGKIRETLEIYEIDGDTLRKIEESQASDTVKVFNLLRSLHDAAKKSGKDNPVLIDIGKRAEVIADLFKQRQKTTQQALEALKQLAAEAHESNRETRRHAGEYGPFLFWLRNAGIEEPRAKAKRMNEILQDYPHWRTSATHRRRFKQELYKVLLRDLLKEGKGVSDAKDWVDRITSALEEAER
ncbi:MAG TPA: type I restriction endonuclease subunit R, partial [Acidobacteriota bacterium]|nr:type I restriction endonuclease subunit R [Acidobacteriota bacterium]